MLDMSYVKGRRTDDGLMLFFPVSTFMVWVIAMNRAFCHGLAAVAVDASHLSSWSLHKFACEIQTKHCLCAAVSKLSTCTSTHGQHGTDAFGFEFVDCEVHLSTAVANPGLLSAQLDTEKESMGPMCFLRVSSYLFLSCFCRRHQYALYRRSRNMFIGNHQRLPQI